MRRGSRGRCSAAVGVLAALVAAGCSEPETVPLGPFLAGGDFIAAGTPAPLVLDAGEGGAPPFWLPPSALPVDGWGRVLRGWRPIGASATLDLWRPEGDASELVLELRRRRSTEALRVAALVNGEHVGTTALGPGRTRARHPVPERALGPVNRVELRFDPPLRQPEVGAIELRLTRIGLQARGGRRVRRGPREPRFVLEAERSGVSLLSSGVYVVPLTIPPAASRLVFETRSAGAGDPESRTRVRLWALDAEGERHDLARAGDEAGGSDWVAAEVEIEHLRGRSVFLAIEAEVPDGGPRVVLRDLRLVLDAALSAPPPPPAAVPVPRDPLPDVVLIVLDAARGDRFDGTYARKLTPNVDRIAPESLVFDRAYSDCPNTVCSIPNLITGRSLLETGDVYAGVKLGDEVVTLAESLRAAGYRTVGITANPNNSATRNRHQGFDLWRELWGRNHRDALGMSRLAAEIVAGQPRDEPLFLQLHYLPPHQPYAPPPDFDLYTDPGYRGPVQPGKPLDLPASGPGSLAPPDLRQLIGLYDGNLRFADAAVGAVLESLRAAGRWSNTLLVLTSDHGEALLEHGYHGHNSTLFNEMLHVPLLFRLPGGEVGAGIDTGRLAALSDVVPTVLGYLGLEPAPGIDGIDLLRTPPDPRRPRVIYHRTNHKRPWSAAHSRFWKLIVRPVPTERMLFRLVDDPGESSNLAAARPWTYAGMALLLRRRLESAAGRSLEALPVELGDDERAVLEALGYVR